MASVMSVYKLRVFTLNDVIDLMDMSHSAAAGSLARWQAQGKVKKVRRNLYVAIDPATDAPIADKYELASKVSESSYVGWHTALEFHGVAHQPFYNAFVANGKRFNDFHFEGVDYKYCVSPFPASEENGIVSPVGNPYVRVTDVERTIVDCCDKIDRAGGPEELLHCMEGITLINEEKLMKYLALYDKSFLCQKVGFFMEQCKEANHISSDFIEMCRCRGAIHTKRLTNSADSDRYLNRWKLYVPQACLTTATGATCCQSLNDPPA